MVARAADDDRRCLCASLVELRHELLDAALTRVGGLRIVDREREAPLVAVRQALEEALRLGVAIEGRREVGWHLDLAWLGVELEIDIENVARLHTGRGTMFGRDADEV